MITYALAHLNESRTFSLRATLWRTIAIKGTLVSNWRQYWIVTPIVWMVSAENTAHLRYHRTPQPKQHAQWSYVQGC